MLKWAVYSKKNQDVQVPKQAEAEPSDQLNGPYFNRQIRRSLDAPSVKKSKKPSRYQRRSIGSTARKNNIKYVDKENINTVRSTPNYYKEGFVKKVEAIALKDVSNITPTSTTPSYNLENRLYFVNDTKHDKAELPPTPPTYSRRVREAKKRKLEMSSNNNSLNHSLIRNGCTTKSERRIVFTPDTSPRLNHSSSEPSLNDLSDKLSSSLKSQRNSLVIAHTKAQPVSTTTTTNQGLVEIEYDEDLVINCVEKPLVSNTTSAARTTLPIFGHHIFLENPLYFNKNETATTSIRPLKRTRKKSSEFESSFKSPSVDKKDAHSLVRDACSPVSMTPLSVKLADLRFSAMSTHNKSQRAKFNPELTEYFPKVENHFIIPLRDEETSTEMENKFILSKDSITNETEVTVSTTQMGDITLERMIEDIIKSTKILKTRRRILNRSDKCQSPVQEETSIADAKEVFVNLVGQNKGDVVIKEAKYVNLSRNNSISPSSSPKSHKVKPMLKSNEKILKTLPMGCVFLDDGDGYNEREVKTPDFIGPKPKARSSERKINLSRSQSMNANSIERRNLDCVSSESTPDLFLATKDDLRLKRQKCIRRKKSTVSNESWKPKRTEPKSMLTLEMGIPSPATELQNVSISDAHSSLVIEFPEHNELETSLPKDNCSFKSNVSHSSVMSHRPIDDKTKRPRELFGLTLENGIPSPITPVSSLKRPSGKLSEERANKSSKLDEDLMNGDAFTPVIEHKSSRRCLTYSPDEGSIDSSDEKRRSTASNRLERSADRFQQLKGTIDLEIMLRNDVIDVHVIRCRDLQKPCGKTDDINAYAKVVINGLHEYPCPPSQRSIFQRTSVLYGKKEPEFQRHLKLPIPPAVYDHQILHISVWHRDKKCRRSEFLGCVSFPLKDAIKGDISGTYFLQSQVSGPKGQSTEVKDRCYKDASVTEGKHKMATDNIEGAGTKEETAKENHSDKGLTSNGAGSASTLNQAQSVTATLQKEADEHLFLRYLELDPPDDPAAPKKGPRQGRTPFTTTRKLTRVSSGGFGFTVVWTKPPRVERVVAGGSAERSGLRAGDYIVFIGNKNVVVTGEEEVRNLVKSAGPILNMETFRRLPQNGAGPKPKIAPCFTPLPTEAALPPAPRSPRAAPAPASPAQHQRPPTACSSTSQSLDRRKLHLPQVTFSKETPGLISEGRRRALMAVVAREQHFSTCLQFGMVRFVSPLAERADLIAPSDHQLLFQNLEEILRLSEDILEQVIQEESEIHTSTVVAVYLQKTPLFLSLYRKYCLGLKRADCVLVKKSKDPSGAFSRFCTSPPIPRRRPDITSLVHKPLEQFRELLRLMRAAAAASGATGPYDTLEKKQLQVIVEQLQTGYQDVTAGSGLMGLAGDGKPLLSVSDLESRLVFTRCKPFVLSTPGRQWIFGGELSKVEGRAIRPYWALLFSDLLLFATVSRDRVLFVTEEPVSLGSVCDTQFNLKKKATEFRLILGRPGGDSPLVSCAPRAPGRRVTVVLRAPSIDLKAVWQSLLQRQVYRAHTIAGTPLGSPLDSPDPQLTFSLATLDSQQRQTRRSSVETQTCAGGSATEGAKSIRSKGSTMHLQRWMTQLPESEEMDPLDQDMETWSVEELRKRSQELNLLDVAGLNAVVLDKSISTGDKKESDKSPSKSSNSGSQITVRTSPVVVDTIPVCRQCHKKCLSKPNSPLVSQRETPIPDKPKNEVSPQNSSSSKNSKSPCSATCGYHKQRNLTLLERKGAMKLRPEDVPKAALKVIDSIEQSQKMLKSTSYDLKHESPLMSRSMSRSPHTKSQLELRHSVRTPSPSCSSRNNSPLSTSHTTCSSIVFNSSSSDLRVSNSNISNQVQCVIAQEKYINEVKCVENITLSKTKGTSLNHNNPSPAALRKEQITRQKAENVLNKVLGMNIITKRENVGTRLKSMSVFLDDESLHEDDHNPKVESRLRRSPRMGVSAVTKINGDINKKTEIFEDFNANTKTSETSDEDLELGPLMLMGLSAINPATHLMQVDPFKRSISNSNTLQSRPGSLGSVKSDSPVPNIAIVPATPDYNTSYKTDPLNVNVDDSPESPDLPDEPPYISLKRYGTMSSLERLPSDETDDGNVPIRLNSHEPDISKDFNPAAGSTGGIMGWTARAGSFVVEKMNIFSYTESVPNTSQALKQPSFLERCLGVSEWKPSLGTEDGTGETGEGSGASGEDAWGTPSSGDLSDNMPDSEHGTLSSPTKSSSSYAGDDDTELMMDELLMAPTITGPTTLRPLLPRRRLEPLMEEECSDSESEDNKPTPTNPEDQGSVRGPSADDYCAAPPRPSSACLIGARGGGADGAVLPSCAGGAVRGSPDRTPTNEGPSMLLPSASRECAEAAATGVGVSAAEGRQDSASSASTPSTLERTTIHNPATPPQETITATAEPVGLEAHPQLPTDERLSPREEMRLALNRGRDILAEQEESWGGASDHWSFRAACQKSLLRRVASADAVTVHAPRPSRPAHRTAPHITSHNSVYAWKVPEIEKPMEMESLARVEALTMRSRTRSLCQNGKILGFLRRRASSDSPRREPLFGTPRPFSPRRTTVSNNGYYKICFVNGYV